MELVLVHIFQTPVDREVSDGTGFDEFAGDDERRKVGFREISVVHRVFLGSLGGTHPFFIVPSAGFLGDSSSRFDYFDLTFEFIINSATDGREGIDILEFDTIIENSFTRFSDGYIHVASELPFLHVSIGCSAPSHKFLEFFEIPDNVFFGTEIRFGDNLHKRASGTVVITKRFIPGVDELSRVGFDVHSFDFKTFYFVSDKRTNNPVLNNRVVELGNLKARRGV
ncbi:MAG: hypothetical protein ACD_78C00122G0001, partial [uncultured bacterium (gcode 4)]